MHAASLAFSELLTAARDLHPQVAVVLGSGMGPVAQRLESTCSVPYLEVPGLAAPSIAGHTGCITLGTWAERHVLVFSGRLHYYEGHPWRRVVLPVQTAQFLGARVLLLTNAAGGIHEQLQPGSLMAIRDHIDWTRPSWWRYPGPGGLGPARPSPYTPRLLDLLGQAAERLGMELSQGTYGAMTGPSYETPAEIRALKICGADAVGMSTAREAQAAADKGMRCAAISCITNRAAGLSTGPIHHGEVLATAATQKERLADLIAEFLRGLDTKPSPDKDRGRD
jgi:purine-nucleoside phosphorylase